MNKQQIETRIEVLRAEDEALRSRKDAIRDKYSRPTQWMKDQKWQEIAARRQAIGKELAKLSQALGKIEDQEWVDRMGEAYPDGEV
jgi:hypothetical protein